MTNPLDQLREDARSAAFQAISRCGETPAPRGCGTADCWCMSAAERIAESLLALPAISRMVEDGWVLVPRGPTEAMIDAYCEAHRELGFHAWANCSFVWPRVLAAALNKDS